MSNYPSRTPRHGFFIKEIKYHGELDLYGLEEEVSRMIQYPHSSMNDWNSRIRGIDALPIIIILSKAESIAYPIKPKDYVEKKEVKQEVKQTNKLLLI